MSRVAHHFLQVNLSILMYFIQIMDRDAMNDHEIQARLIEVVRQV